MSRTARSFLLSASTLLGACGGGAGDGPAAPLVVDAVSVSPATLTLPLDGEQSLSASARAGGQTVSGRPVAWRSSDGAIATVSSSGVVRGVRAGTAQISAAIDGRTASAPVTVENPTPIPSAIAPQALVATDSSRTLTITGSGFANDAVVEWNGAARPTTVSSRTQLTVTLAAGDAATPGDASVRVRNPQPGGGLSAPLVLAVTPVPVARVVLSRDSARLVPSQSVSVTASVQDSAGRVLPSRAVIWSTSAPSVATVSSSGVIRAEAPGVATLTATSEQRSASVFVRVREGGVITSAGRTLSTTNGAVVFTAPAGGVSDSLFVWIDTVSTVPTSASLLAGSAVQVGTDGGSFTAPVSVSLRYPDGPLPNGLNAADLAIHRLASSAWTPLAARTVNGTTRRVSGSTSTLGVFALLALPPNPVPSLLTLEPTAVLAGSGAVTLTVTGAAFAEGVQLRWNGAARPTTRVSATQLTAAISAADVADAGARAITVFNPAPGGGVSNALSLDVAPPPASGAGALTVGTSHTCLVTTNAEAYCWGLGSSGAVGNESVGAVFAPSPVPGATGFTFTRITTGSGFACGLTAAGAAYCWGSGALGNGSAEVAVLPVAVSGGQQFTALEANQNHVCGITVQQAAYCWGSNFNGELGNGSTQSSSTPVAVSGGHLFRAIALGPFNSCGITIDGALWCWGSGGPKSGVASFTNILTPRLVAAGLSLRTLTMGDAHGCALDDTGAARCWGTGNRLGNGSTTDALVPGAVSGGRQYVQVQARFGRTCAVTADGAGFCWGAALGGTPGGLVPAAMPRTDWATLSIGTEYTCGVTRAGEGYCWGLNQPFGVLGVGPAATITRPLPTRVEGAQGYAQISTSQTFACGLTTTGTVRCWGSGNFGQFGNGRRAYADAPLRVQNAPRFTSVSAGNSTNGFSCALAIDGAAWCWGNNANGQLGNGSGLSAGVPVLVSGGHRFASVVAGGAHACGLTSEGAAWCWGRGTNGQLGDGGSSSRSAPVAVSGGHTFRSLVAGEFHSCGITTSGAALCWGANNNGQIGIGNAGGMQLTPTLVTGGHSWATLAAGNDHSCGITVQAVGYCWGRATDGQLGAGGGPVPNGTPVQFGGATLWRSVSAGRQHSCAVTLSGGAFCWGAGSSGQLGRGTTAASNVPVLVSGGLGFSWVTAGTTHSCGVTFAGVPYCWGAGANGALGTGNSANSLVPVPVAGSLRVPSSGPIAALDAPRSSRVRARPNMRAETAWR